MPVRPQLRALASTRARRPKKFAAKRGHGFCAGESSEPSALNLLLTYCTTQPAAPMGSCMLIARYLSPIALCRQWPASGCAQIGCRDPALGC